jgi:hypothetical protein
MTSTPNSGMVLLVGSIGYSFFRLRFVYALSVMWALYAEFILLTALSGAYSDLRSFAVAIVLLAVACSVYSWFAYWREFFIRKGFLMNLNLKREERNHNRSVQLPSHTALALHVLVGSRLRLMIFFFWLSLVVCSLLLRMLPEGSARKCSAQRRVEHSAEQSMAA